MKEYIKFVDDLPLIVKVLLAIFVGPIVYGIYRIAKGKLLIGILWIIFGYFFIFIIDIVTLVMNGKITFLLE
ncbi:hypothetical protein HF295_06140 [Hujiaoplasma nucleasis]|uniref:TM2 domain-containing protein n=1 Tax=Hujiaoplasma nucleasis TaxID=2725268 RepID=A0A7L6N7B8_9MOLU|nr:hypothetical protein [Hujiaoplasma nucleasis]QLY40449.1 hypothetical protein HF295_06140 [Hujiaoplasma nucleasis]